MDIFKIEIAKQISNLSEVPINVIIPLLEIPKNSEHGNITLAIPKLQLNGNPSVLAKELASKIKPNEYIKSAFVTGIFLNFRVSYELLRDNLLKKVVEKQTSFQVDQFNKQKKAIIEFSSPALIRSFDTNFIRSTLIGNFINKVLDANGFETISINYLLDWGIQQGFLVLGFKKYGSDVELLKDPINHLLEVYKKIENDAEIEKSINKQGYEYFMKLECKDKEIFETWLKLRDLFIKKIKGTYARLNIHFNIYTGESQTNELIYKTYQILEGSGLLIDSEGAKIIDLEKYNLGKVVIKKLDGTILYIVRDIGTAIMRYETYQFDNMYYVATVQQDLHFKQLFKILELLGLEWYNRCCHINFGKINNLSTLKEKVTSLDEFFDEVKQRMDKIIQRSEVEYGQMKNIEVADLLGVSAVITQDFTSRRIKDYQFNIDKITSFCGETGPYLQYTYSRVSSIIRNNNREIDSLDNLNTLTETCAIELIYIISQYPDMIKNLLKKFEPCSATHYAFTLAKSINICAQQLRVMNRPDSIANPRLILFKASRITLGNVLNLIGITPLDQL